MDIDVNSSNTSGQGLASQVPPEIRRWNWGAFLLNWIWGIGNNVLLALLVFVPFFGFIWMFVVGARGNEWAWRNKRWDSVAHFQATQRRWARWGVVVCVAFIALACLGVLGIGRLLKDSEAYKLAQLRLDADTRIAEIIGQPISTGFPMGQIHISGPRGTASLSFSAEGPKGSGTVFVEATKDLGVWKINRMAFEEDSTGRRIDLSPEPSDDREDGTV
ncbi:cytochrome c oxidase assembly factor Coa1 family protein [Roseateles asaccharophilus]|uniref:Cytochrome oxidase complex assembly protein 1 n=1 Tax=Roseateles asaccharophilus TaxID=582607 RepID=A0ABU2AF12_9BURK|nr:cytochrome c oxidase assembly factor Coa1 family protein [Roseateles asaccharophilus]MDR7335796.1 hypothetical protein [Roseateles asaccharophilus]